MPRKLDPSAIPQVAGTMYPPPYDAACRARTRRALGNAAGLTQFGVNLLTLPPGAWSSQRHWHSHEDEFVYVLSGEVILSGDAGDEVLRTGDCAGFRAGDTDGHCLKNLSDAPAVVLEVGSRVEGDATTYPGIDLLAPAGGKPALYIHTDGTPYTGLRRRGPE